MGKLDIKKLAEGIYVFTTYKELNTGPFPSNGMYILTDDGVVLFDTPWDVTQIQPLLDTIAKRHQKKVVLCISTHFHDDRTAGLNYLKQQGVKTYSSKQTYALCKEHNEKQAEYQFIKDTAFHIGERTFETYYPGEGHSPDNLVLWLGKEQILYGGCLIKSLDNQGLGYIADANLPEWKKSIQKVMAKYPHPRYVIPGHFSWDDKGSLQHTLKLLSRG